MLAIGNIKINKPYLDPANLKEPSDKGWKYTLDKPYLTYFPLLSDIEFSPNQYIEIFPSGLLYIKDGYSWDGPTCMLKLEELIVPSLIHDALYQCLREGANQGLKKIADLVFYEALLKNKVNGFFAYLMYTAVKYFAPKSSYTPKG